MNPAVKGKTDLEGAPYSMVATYAGLLILGGSGPVVLLSIVRGGLFALLTLIPGGLCGAATGHNIVSRYEMYLKQVFVVQQ